jgi:hypothetical protein
VAQKLFFALLSACFAGSELPPAIPQWSSAGGFRTPAKGRVHSGLKVPLAAVGVVSEPGFVAVLIARASANGARGATCRLNERPELLFRAGIICN